MKSFELKKLKYLMHYATMTIDLIVNSEHFEKATSK